LPTIQLHYDGWLTLPAEARRHLAVVTGSRLEIELTDGGLFLRPAGQAAVVSPTAVQTAPSPAKPELAQAKTEPDETAAETVLPKRGPGRPRKAVPQDLAPRIKVGGRRKSILPA
jgi:bifunctional DNA-binding transcriptional regulator/antitoxin component of YhaV-PrlF toxin-antitoxin module